MHVWALSASKRNMWAHLTVSAGADSASVLHAAQRAAADFGCDHTCFQLESEGHICNYPITPMLYIKIFIAVSTLDNWLF